MSRKRYISFILLCCFVVIPAHNMVPHHHHDGVFIPEGASSCPLDHPEDHPGQQDGQQMQHQPEHPSNQQEDHQHPLHCDAFNEISFYKNVLPEMSQPSEAPVLYATHPSPEQNINDSAFARRLSINRSVPFRPGHDRQPVPLRGPPPVA